jgi:hypothetical protein
MNVYLSNLKKVSTGYYKSEDGMFEATRYYRKNDLGMREGRYEVRVTIGRISYALTNPFGYDGSLTGPTTIGGADSLVTQYIYEMQNAVIQRRAAMERAEAERVADLKAEMEARVAA